MKTIRIVDKAGVFAENKDIARDIRLMEILPTLKEKQEMILDFDGVDAVTQSFIHALISDAFRQYGPAATDYLVFKSCNNTVKKIINIVIDYMQESD